MSFDVHLKTILHYLYFQIIFSTFILGNVLEDIDEFDSKKHFEQMKVSK